MQCVMFRFLDNSVTFFNAEFKCTEMKEGKPIDLMCLKVLWLWIDQYEPFKATSFDNIE